MAKYCNNCGQALEDNSQFCPACGSRTQAAQNVQQPIQDTQQPAQSFQQPIQDYQQQTYSQPVYTQPPVNQAPANDKSGLAVTSFVLSLIAIPFSFFTWTRWIALILAVLAFIFGLVAFKSRKKGLAITGFVISLVLISYVIYMMIFWASLISSLLW